MTTSLFTKETHPNRDFADITQIGLKAHALAAEHTAEIEARLPGVTATLKDDVESLLTIVPEAKATRQEAMAATATQNAILRQAYSHVQTIRTTVRKSGAPSEVLDAYGVGKTTYAKKVSDVSAALQQIVSRATSAPAEAEAFGVVAADVAAMKALIAALATAEMEQEVKRASAPMSTKARNATANRVLQTAVVIAGAGMRAFPVDSADYASFKELMTSTAKPRKSNGKKGPEGAAPKADPGGK